MKAVAIGGGHGTAVTLRALRRLTSDITAIVSVADNGGSSGRLREMLNVAAVGDVRKCLVALADRENALAHHFEHRFSAGDLEGHALGNLLLAGLIDATGDLEASIETVADLLGVSGTVLPASCGAVTLSARTAEGRTTGQTEVAAAESIRLIATEPSDVDAPDRARRAIIDADLVVIGPGSLYTSVLAACIVPGIIDALRSTKAKRVLVANLRQEEPETSGYSLSDHVRAVLGHGVPIDVVLSATETSLSVDGVEVPLIRGDLTTSPGLVHDDAKLARCLDELVA